MTFVPFILLTVTKGAEAVAQNDPHGFILSLVAVCVVFSALLILYGIYSLLGAIFTGRLKALMHMGGRKKGETAAAIAMALDAELGGEAPETAAAIAMALAMYSGEHCHDGESFVITFPPTATAWADKTLTFRKKPLK